MIGRLGLSSYAYFWATRVTEEGQDPTMDPWKLLARVADLGLEALQIADNVPLTGLGETDLVQLGQAAKRQDVVLEVGCRDLDLSGLRTHAHIAHWLGARILRFVPWSRSETRQRVSLDQLCLVVDQLIPLCRELDVTLAMENYFDLTDEELVACLEQVNDERFGVCLDTANSTGDLQQPLQTVELLAPYAVSLHLKDFVVTKPLMGYRISGIPLGQGWLDAAAVVDIVARTGRQPNVLLELWVDPAENHEATLRKEDEWVRQSVVYARNDLGIGRSRPQENL